MVEWGNGYEWACASMVVNAINKLILRFFRITDFGFGMYPRVRLGQLLPMQGPLVQLVQLLPNCMAVMAVSALCVNCI